MIELEGRGPSRRFGWPKWVLEEVTLGSEKEVDVLGLASKRFVLQLAASTHVWDCGDRHGSDTSPRLLSLSL